MTEFEVWKATSQYLEQNGFSIIATCPPGGSSFLADRCCLIHPVTKKHDEPDIMAIRDDLLLFVECKPTFAGLKNRNLKDSGESDVDKLVRLSRDMARGDYDLQLEHNYGISTRNRTCLFYVSYGSKKSQGGFDNLGFLRVDNDRESNELSVRECVPRL